MFFKYFHKKKFWFIATCGIGITSYSSFAIINKNLNKNESQEDIIKDKQIIRSKFFFEKLFFNVLLFIFL